MDMKPFPDPFYPKFSPEHRYQTDPVFRQLVDTLEASIHRAQFTPSELRDAAMLASIRYESLRVRHIFSSRTGASPMSLTIVHLSDTHGHRVPVPHGDVLIHTGDFSRGRGTEQDCEDFANWMCDLTHPVKILVPGNHDEFVEREPEEARKLLWPVTLLIDEALVVDGITIYGTPWSVQFLDWAFMKPDADLADVYAKIPPETTILASHGPAYGMFDHLGPQWKDCVEQHVGSRALRERVEALRLPCVLSGHIHDAYGCVADRGTLYANSSILNDDYRVAHAPRVLSARKDLVVETPEML